MAYSKGYDPREVAAQKSRRYEGSAEWTYAARNALKANRPLIKDNEGNPVLDVRGIPYRGYNPTFDDEGNLLSFETVPKVKSWDIDNLDEESFANQGVYRAPSELTEIPTSSTNASRPRTLAAGWRAYAETRRLDADLRLGTLTVMFRDGTLYNYYDVPYTMWSSFKGSLSKGPYVNYKNKNQGSDGPLLAFPRGPATLADVPASVVDNIMLLAREAQLSFATTNRARAGYKKPDMRRKKPGKPQAQPYVPKSAKYRSGLNPNQRRGRNPNAGKGKAK